MAKLQSVSLWRIFVFLPAIVIFVGSALNYAWGLSNKVPKKFLKGNEVDIALKFLALASVPMFFMIISIMLYRAFTIYGETLLRQEETVYLKTSKMILNNTTEQLLLFVINLLAAAALKAITKEQIVISVLVHVFARLVF